MSVCLVFDVLAACDVGPMAAFFHSAARLCRDGRGDAVPCGVVAGWKNPDRRTGAREFGDRETTGSGFGPRLRSAPEASRLDQGSGPHVRERLGAMFDSGGVAVGCAAGGGGKPAAISLQERALKVELEIGAGRAGL